MSRSFGRKRSRQWVGLVIVLLIVLVRWWTDQPLTDEPYLGPPSAGQHIEGDLQPGDYDVERVVDGDTIVLVKDKARVRLQGIDTPETVKKDTAVQAWGPEATDYTKRFIREAGSRIRVEIDGEAIDQYGRNLAFIWSGDRMLNEELVREGLARAKLGYDYSNAKKHLLRRAQEEARRARRGIWSNPR